MKRLGLFIRVLTLAILLAFAGLVIHAEDTKSSASTQESRQEKEPCPAIRTCHFFMGYL